MVPRGDETDTQLMGECNGCAERDEEQTGDVPHLLASEPVMDRIWWPMDGGGLDGRRCRVATSPQVA